MAKTKEAKKAPDAKPAAAPAVSAPPPNYTVVARRYRPQQFADLIGQEHVAQALTNAIASGRIAHAYLFTGARGVGKTSSARILAKALNCEQGPTPTPCDRCDSCVSVAASNDVDVLEIDGASNNKVDEARDLIKNAGYRPTRGRFKIYIIDEVHMLSTPAFNALLKTIEEPPPHVKFILATTEVQKIPITILSRCQRYDFATVGPAKIFASLKHIAAKENLKADDDALRMVAARAAGSMRDSQTMLDQLLAATDGTLTSAAVNAVLGTASDERVGELADAIAAADAKRAIELVAQSSEQGLQLAELTDQLVDFWRGLMLASVAGKDAAGLPLSPTMQERIVSQAGRMSLDAVLAGLDILAATKAKMRSSPHSHVLLEVAVVRLCRLGDLLAVTELAQWVNGAGGGPAATQPPTRMLAGAAAAAPPTDAVKKKPLTGVEVPPNGAVQGSSGGSVRPAEVTEANFEQVWREVLQHVGLMLSAYLAHIQKLPAIIGPNALAIHFPSAYSSSFEVANSDRNRELIGKALKHVTRADWTVRVELAQAPAVATTDAAPATGPARPAAARGRSAVLEMPFFQSAADVLGAQLVKLDDGFDPLAAVTATPDVADLDTPALTDPDEV